MKKLLLFCILCFVASGVYANDIYGVFKVLEDSGDILGGVNVTCSVNGGQWNDCGFGLTEDYLITLDRSFNNEGEKVNFIQHKYVCPQEGDRVIWRFRKQGYVMELVSIVVPDRDKLEIFETVKMCRLDEKNSNSGRDGGSCDSDFDIRILDIEMRDVESDCEIRWPNGEVAFRGGVKKNYRGRDGTGVYLISEVFDKDGTRMGDDRWRFKDTGSQYERHFGSITLRAHIIGDMRKGTCRITAILRE